MNSIGRDKAWRIAFNAVKNMGLPTDKARPHELFLFAKLSTDEGQYTMKLNYEEQQRILNISEGLLDRDSFVAVGMSIGILPVPVIATVEYPSAAAPNFWPDPNVFDTAAGGATLSEAQALESIYWGRHTLITNEGVRIQKRPNQSFRTVQETQGSASTANMQNDQEIKEIGAPVRYGGGDQNEIIIDIKCDDKTHLAGAAARQNYLMVGLYGAILKGSTTKVYTR